MDEQPPSEGAPPSQPQPPPPYGQPQGGFPQGQHQQVPRCMRCGAVTWWKPAPLLRVMDVVIILALFLIFGVGLIYLTITLIMRSNPRNREKICPACGANEQWTFIY
jgi:hypothetical protein